MSHKINISHKNNQNHYILIFLNIHSFNLEQVIYAAEIIN